ncbi:Glycosyl hydrolases family 35 [Popillia japonica]|uniref:Glycosyl hydrolases family 35 n=1 Tax=Popillia japonica TaxID=7064 RepID=A0AAW1KSP2_POPJA
MDGILYTANFQVEAEKQLSILQGYQPGKPLMVMEFWTGWYDHWAFEHNTRSNEDFAEVLENIVSFPSSVNFYMFHGGTNWGFMNGANIEDDSTDNVGGTIIGHSSIIRGQMKILLKFWRI